MSGKKDIWPSYQRKGILGNATTVEELCFSRYFGSKQNHSREAENGTRFNTNGPSGRRSSGEIRQRPDSFAL